MKNVLWVVGVLISLVAMGCNATPDDVDAGVNYGVSGGQSVNASATADGDDDDDDDENEEDIPLDQVPDKVKDAARDAVPGLVLEEAEKETENGIVVYSLEGKANGKPYEVEVSEAGKVLEIEQEEDEDDD